MSIEQIDEHRQRVEHNLTLSRQFNERRKSRFSPYRLPSPSERTSKRRLSTVSSVDIPEESVVLLRQEQTMRSVIGGEERNVKVLLVSAGLSSEEHFLVQRAFTAFTDEVAATIGTSVDEREFGVPNVLHTVTPKRRSPNWRSHFRNMHLDALEDRERRLLSVSSSALSSPQSLGTPVPFEKFFSLDSSRAYLGDAQETLATSVVDCNPDNDETSQKPIEHELLSPVSLPPLFNQTTTMPQDSMASCVDNQHSNGDGTPSTAADATAAAAAAAATVGVTTHARERQSTPMIVGSSVDSPATTKTVVKHTDVEAALATAAATAVKPLSRFSSWLLRSLSPTSAPPPPNSLYYTPVLTRRREEFNQLVEFCATPCRPSLAMSLHRLHAQLIGKGTYGKVFSLHPLTLSVPLVLKRITHNYTPTHALATAEVQMEAQVLALLTQSAVFSPLVQCPHFMTVAAYDTTVQPLCFTGAKPFNEHEPNRLVSQLSAPPLDQAQQDQVRVRTQIVSEHCPNGTLLEYLTNFLRRCDAMADQRRPLLDTEQSAQFAGALVAQLLVAVTVASAAQISHNDLNLCNVFVRSATTDPGKCFAYEFPDGRGTLCVPTGVHVPLLVVGDYGLASVHNWLDDWRIGEVYREDEGVPAPSDRDRLQMMLSLYYYARAEDVKLQHGRLRHLRLSEQLSVDYGHYRPLLFTTLNERERDFATVLSCLYEFAKLALTISPHRLWCRNLFDLSKEALRQLSAQRPTTYEAQLDFVAGVFASNAVYANWLQSGSMNAATKAKCANLCHVPDHRTGKQMNEMMLRLLNSPIEPEMKHIVPSE